MNEEMGKKIQFAYYWTTCRNPAEAARLSGISPEQWPDWFSDKAVRREIRKFQRLFRKDSPGELAKQGLERLVFGLSPPYGTGPEDGMVPGLGPAGLFRVSEWKRAKGGTEEVRFWDKIKALELLIRLEEQEAGRKGARECSVYQALEEGARALEDWEGEDKQDEPDR